MSSSGLLRCFAIALVALVALQPAAGQSQARVARVGYLSWVDTGSLADTMIGQFRQGLRDEGFVEGENLVLLRRSADSEPKRMADLARELDREKVDVFFAPATSMATAAWYANRRTPIVIATILDPVALDFVHSLARPGTRVTGVLTFNKELTAKRLQLLAEAVPGLKRVGVVIDQRMHDSCTQEVNHLDAAAKRAGVEIVYADVRGPGEIEAAFRRFATAGVQAVADTLVSSPLGVEKEFAELAVRYRLPSMHEVEDGVRAGGLFSYGPDFGAVFRRAGRYTGRILKGADPAEMAMEAPREFRLVVNLATARALGIAVPQSILLRADEVIQ